MSSITPTSSPSPEPKRVRGNETRETKTSSVARDVFGLEKAPRFGGTRRSLFAMDLFPDETLPKLPQRRGLPSREDQLRRKALLEKLFSEDRVIPCREPRHAEGVTTVSVSPASKRIVPISPQISTPNPEGTPYKLATPTGRAIVFEGSPIGFRSPIQLNGSFLASNNQSAEQEMPTIRKRKKNQHEPFIPAHRPEINAGGGKNMNPYRYMTRSKVEELPLFYLEALCVQKYKEIEINGNAYKIEFIEGESSRGQYNLCAKIAPNQQPIFEHIRNEELLVKVFRDHAITVTDHVAKVPTNAHLNILEQYNELRDAGIPVAEIYNEEMVREGKGGFFLVQFIPYPFFPEWINEDASLNTVPQEQINQLAKIFRLAYENDIIPDLKPDNLRLTGDGVLTLIDFREHKLDSDDKDPFYPGMIRSFRCKKGDLFYAQLNPDTSCEPK